MSKTAHSGFAVLLLMIVAAPAGAQDDAAGWLEKMITGKATEHYKVRLAADLNIAQEGMEAVVKMKGSLNHASATRFHAAFEMDMTMGGVAMVMKTTTVADGENLWIEVDSPMMGGKTVLHGSTDDLKKLDSASDANMGGLGSLGQDPIEHITAMIGELDITLEGVEDGRVTLRADVTDENRSGLGDLGKLGNGLQYITLVLDEKKAMPLRLEIGGEQPLLTMNFTDYEFFGAGQVIDSDYAYTPPDGVPVRDIGTMFGR